MSEKQVVILGVGVTPFGRFPDLSLEDLGREAALAALKDAGVDYKEIEAGFCGRVQQGAGVGMRVFGELGQTGIPITNVELACASSSRASMIAAEFINAGIYDLCLVIGVEKMQRGPLGSGAGSGSGSYQAQMGMGVMPATYAMMARRHMDQYGTKAEHFAQVAVKSHRNGVLNPRAQYRQAMTLEEVMNSRMIAEPITLYQCCPTTDGASAVVLASLKMAAQHTTKPVYLSGWAGGSPKFSRGEAGGDEGPTEALANRAYEIAGLGPKDVNVAQVHDAFSPGEILTIEEMGFCPKGEGGPYVWEGQTEITGRTPVNTDGGLLSRGHPMGATGGAMISELTWQLRGEAGGRQVKDAKVALMHNAGIGGTNVMVFHT